MLLINQYPKAYDYRGASMGRRSQHAPAQTVAGRFHLRQVRLDSGGYDKGGAYWGHAEPLYRAVAEDTENAIIDFYFRAVDRDDAKATVRKSYPDARFFR